MILGRAIPMILDDYRATTRVKGYSYATQKTYTHWLYKYLRFLKGTGP